MQRRLSDGWLRSGRDSTTTKTPGPNTSLSRSSTDGHCLLRMRFLQKSYYGRSTISAQHGTPAARSPTSTTSPLPWKIAPCRRAPISQRCHHRIPPFRCPHRRLPLPPTRQQARPSADAPKPSLLLQLALATLPKPTWAHKNCGFPMIPLSTGNGSRRFSTRMRPSAPFASCSTLHT